MLPAVMIFRGLPDGGRLGSWAWVAGWTLAIFLTIPFARAIQRFFEAILGSHLYLAASGIAGAFFVIIALTYIFRRRKTNIAKRVTWLVILTACSVWVMKFQLQTPGEAIHFFQYGILSFLLFRAWSHYIRDPFIYIISAFSIVLLASVDEFLQWMIPGRYWDFRDIRLNLMAGVLVQLFIALVIHPSGITRPVARRSVRWFCRLAVMSLLTMGVALSNTPARVDLYATRIPFLRFLANNESVMNEFGFRHSDPSIGVFFSRFPAPELLRIDAERGAEAGDILARYRILADYREFLQTFTSSVDPFLHELRVHLHRRDHYEAVAWKYRDSDPVRFIHHLTVAERENRILETYFPHSLATSGYAWPEEMRARVQEFADPAMPYTSAVSDHLVTGASELELWVALALAGLILAGVYYRYGRRLPAAVQ
ncbi:MAG TPA: VanZ family protein [Kiritimatiellia bacterium]|nr:VanZ family protein [Kiritimatiellia bacterium]